MKAIGLALAAGLLTFFGDPQTWAQETLSNPVTGFHLSLMRAPDLENGFLGWIELHNGDKAAGYIYLQNGPPIGPHLSSNKDYIVMDIPTEKLATMLEILREDKPIRITFSNFGTPTAFLEVGPERRLDAEQSELLTERFGVSFAPQ